MRSLSSTADAARLLRAHAVLAAVRIDFPSPVGTKWFTSRWRPGDVSSSNLRRTVKSWGPCSELLQQGPALSAAAASVILSDQDGELRGWWESFEFQRLTGSLVWAVFTTGQAEPATTDAAQVLACTIVPPVRWLEGRREVPLGLSDISAGRDAEVGTRAVPGFHASFVNIGEEDSGRVIPAVFGRPDKVRAISLDTGARARLASAISDSATTLVVDDASGFPQGSSVDIMVGDEIMTGSFSGNTFTITARGKVVHSGTLTADSTENCMVVDSGLIGYDDNWCVGYCLVVTPDRDYGGNSIYGSPYTLTLYAGTLSSNAVGFDDWQQGRRIVRFDGSTGKIEYSHPFVVEQTFAASGGLIEMTGSEVRLKAGTPYQIRSLAEPHDAGAEVRLHVPGAPEYAVGMDQCTVRRVYLHGVPRSEHKYIVEHHQVQGVVGSLEGFARATLEQYQPEPEPDPDWLPVPAEYWSTAFYTLAGTPGFTTLVLSRPPGEIPGFVCDSDEVLVDVEGPRRKAAVIANPADVIASLLDAYTDLVFNLLDHAEQFDQWSKATGVTVTANAAAAPDGTQTADKLVEASGLSAHYVYQEGISCDGGSAYLFSCHARAAERTKLKLYGQYANGVAVKYDLSAGTVISAAGAVDDYGIEDEGDGWYRCWLKATSTNAKDDAFFRAYVLDAAGNDVYTGDGSSGLYLWGAVFNRAASLGDYDKVLDFSGAKALLAGWGMSFALADQRMLTGIIGDLAFQARSRIRWLGSVPELLYQHADGGDADLAVASSRMLLDSIERSREEMELAASEVAVHWIERGRRQTHVEKDTGGQTRLGRRAVDIECWAYNSGEAPTALARFYLARIRHLHDLARLDASVFAVGIEPGDTVTLDAGGHLPEEPVKGQVKEAVFSPGRSPEPPAAVGMAVKLYHWAGCSLGCEGSCETMGCETYCESWFEPGACWACEASCQAACELGCTAAAEFLCAANNCQAACTAGCEAICLADEAAHQGVRRSPRIRAYRDRIMRDDPGRKKIAIVATAHYLVRVMAAMLGTGEVWREKA